MRARLQAELSPANLSLLKGLRTMSDAVDNHLAKALASLADVSARQLHATAGRSGGGGGCRTSPASSATSAYSRESGSAPKLADFHLRQAVKRGGDDLAGRIEMPRHPSGGTCATRWPSGMRNSPPPFRKLRLRFRYPARSGSSAIRVTHFATR